MASKDFLVGVIVGSVIGAATALLYAPQAGADTRQFLKDKANDAADRTTDLAQQARDRSMEMANQTRDRATQFAQQVQSKTAEVTDQVRGRATDIADQVRTRATDMTKQAQDMVDRGKGAIDTQKQAVMSAVEAGKQAYTDKQNELQQEVAQDTGPALGGGAPSNGAA